MTQENAEQLFVAVTATLKEIQDLLINLCLAYEEASRTHTVDVEIVHDEYAFEAAGIVFPQENVAVDTQTTLKAQEEREKYRTKYKEEAIKITELLQKAILVLNGRNNESLFHQPVLTKSIKDMTREEIIEANRAIMLRRKGGRPSPESMAKFEAQALRPAPIHDFDKSVTYSGGLPSMSEMANMFEMKVLEVLGRPDVDPAKQELIARGVTVESVLKAREERDASNPYTDLDPFEAPNTTSIEAGVATSHEAGVEMSQENKVNYAKQRVVETSNMLDLIEKAKSQ